jgi:AcrR family transcriptional regulator
MTEASSVQRRTAGNGATRRSRRADVTRGRLLDAALAVFLERGYHAATLQEVTERADLGTGTLYLYFRDKQAIYEALARRVLGELRGRWVETVRGETDPIEQVVLMVKTSVEVFARNRALAELFLKQGPTPESWLVHEVGEGIRDVLSARVVRPELIAHLVIGTGLQASRYTFEHKKPLRARELIDTTLAFVRGGLLAAADEHTNAAGGAKGVHPRRRSRTKTVGK